MSFEAKTKPVVFLDRDGTLNVEKGYIRDVNDLVLIEGAARAVLQLNKAGIAAVLVTNQSGTARNYYPETHIIALHERLSRLLGETGAILDAIYYCPHLPEGSYVPLKQVCNCRKPAPGMVELAFQEHPEFSREKSFVIGDKVCDLELARNCKAKAILVKTGYGQESADTIRQNESIKPDFEAHSIVEAVDWVIEDLIE